MTDIEAKALALLNEVNVERGMPAPDYLSARAALIRALEQHEAFRQEVSDIVEAYVNATDEDDWVNLKSLIITEPDPLVEVVKGVTWYDNEITAKEIRAALEARGFEIREKSDV